jgi:hypothetical protein
MVSSCAFFRAPLTSIKEYNAFLDKREEGNLIVVGVKDDAFTQKPFKLDQINERTKHKRKWI